MDGLLAWNQLKNSEIADFVSTICPRLCDCFLLAFYLRKEMDFQKLKVWKFLFWDEFGVGF